MHRLTCGISSLLHSVNLIVFTLLLVHLILCASPHHSLCPYSHHLSFTQYFTPDLKLISFTNPFIHALQVLSALLSQNFGLRTGVTGHCRVCFNFFFRILYVWLCGPDSADHTINFSVLIVVFYFVVYLNCAAEHSTASVLDLFVITWLSLDNSTHCQSSVVDPAHCDVIPWPSLAASTADEVAVVVGDVHRQR